MRARIRPDVYACAALVGLASALFWPHLNGTLGYFGDSDRLNTFLNVRLFEVDGLRAGHLRAWSDLMFMGLGMFGLPYMLPDPLALVVTLFPAEQLFRVEAAVACALVTAAAVTAYVFIRDTVRDPLAA